MFKPSLGELDKFNNSSNCLNLCSDNKLIENRRGNQEWTIQRHRQHWVYETQDKDKQSKKHNTEK